MTTAPHTAITIPTARRTLFLYSLSDNVSTITAHKYFLLPAHGKAVRIPVSPASDFFMRTGYCLSIFQPDYLIHLREQIQSV